MSNNITQRNDFPILSRRIDNYFEIDDEYDNSALYVFNYKNDSGFVVISAEIWHEPICAYVEQGSLSEYDSLPGTLVEWFSKTVENIELLRSRIYTDTATGKAAWYSLLQQTDLSAYNDQLKIKPVDPPPSGCEDWTVTQVGPLLTTTWGQWCTFNESCPNHGCGNFCTIINDHSPTGCVATSMAQLIRYWSPSNAYSYIYSTMPNDHGNGEVQRLMYDAGQTVSMNWTCTGSAASSSLVAASLINNFGFNSASYGNWISYSSFFTVIDNLQNNWPVILNGEATRTKIKHHWVYSDGHNWLCDGYREFSNSCYAYLYFHMNWGWHETWFNNDFNGYYLFNEWNVDGLNFQYAKHYTYNIHP